MRRSRTALGLLERSRRSRTRGETRHGRPGRHGVAVALRRRSSACAHGVAPRGEAERVGWVRFGANPVPGRWPGRASGARREAGGPGRPAEQGRGGESRESREKEREKNLIEFKFESSSKFSNNTRKILNMKDVPKFQILPLLFQAYFHLGPNSKVQFESRQM